MDRPSADEAAHGLGVGTAESDPPPLSPGEFALFSQATGALPSPWIATRRRRRFLFLALAAPGFFAVFATPIHHSLIAMLVGFGLFGAAIVFRLKTEPLFERAQAADLWPSPDPASPATKAARHV
jgi:hypothetical protein